MRAAMKQTGIILEEVVSHLNAEQLLKRYRRESRYSYDSDDSSEDCIPSPMTFHNYAKRRRFSGTEDESENYIRYLNIQ